MECPYCGGKAIVKAGKRYNKYVEKQLYKCNSCKKRFVERDGFENMTYPKEIILKTLHLYAEGLSLSKIRDFIWHAHLLEEFEKKLKPKIKGKKIYDINAIDGKTGYNLGHFLTDTLSLAAFRKFFESLKKRIYDQCLERHKEYNFC